MIDDDEVIKKVIDDEMKSNGITKSLLIKVENLFSKKDDR